MTAKSDIEKMRDTLKWYIGVTISMLIILISGAVRAEMRDNESERQITKITNDYLPYFAFEYFMEGSKRMTNLIGTLPNTTKDDPRYIKALQDWNDFQVELLKQAGNNKRSGESIEKSTLGGE